MRDGRAVPVQAYYEGASGSRRMAGKGSTVSGPNMPIARSLQSLQARSYAAIRNNAYASGARDSYVTNLVGSGIKPEWENPEIQGLWDRWALESDAEGLDSVYGLQALAAGAQFEAGEVLTRFRVRRPTDGLVVPLQLQLIESSHLDPNYSRTMDSGLVRMGIEFNGIGQRTAYHLWRFHPHEKLTAQLNTRVPVPANDVVHMYRRTRPGQLRGVPELTSVIVRLYEIDEMQDATLMRQKIAQLFGAFVKRKTSDVEEDGPDFGKQVSMAGHEDQLTEFVAGAIHYLEDDEEVTFSNPPDIRATYVDWIRSELLAVAKGAGVTYENMTGDLRGVNYSSIRAGLLEFRRRMEALQAMLIVHQWCRPVAARWLDLAVVSGALDLPDYWQNRSAYQAIDWIAPKWAWVDPLKQAMGDLIEVRAGFKPRSDAAAERGYSREKLDNRIKQDNDSADQKGLVFDSDPRRTAASGVAQDALKLINDDEED